MRLVTRSDFDGLACGALLKEAELINSYFFAHPRDIQAGEVEVGPNDILANVPYAPGCGMWFDHHTSEGERLGNISYRGMSRLAPSCARVIYDFLGGRSRFGSHWDPLMDAVDKVDSATLTTEEIQNPSGWILIGYIMDPRTGLGRFHDFRISNLQLMTELIECCRTMSSEQILQMPDMLERALLYFRQQDHFREMIMRCSRLHGDIVVIDLRQEEEIFTGNRFLVYTMFPEAKVSIQINWGRQKRNIALSLGNSITNRGSRANLGSIALRYRGGGHQVVATCQVPPDEADKVVAEIIEAINEQNRAA